MSLSIEVSDLVKHYGTLAAVDGISLEVPPGEVFAFLGPNGAGKSTTVEILEGLRRRTSGEVRVLGRDPWTDARGVQGRIGVIPQDFHFFPKLTPAEAIQLYAGLFGVRPRTQELLERVELADKARDHYDTLSGGQHQKVGLALALVNDPEICFLDEPTTGLDPRARRGIWEVIERLKAEGRTIFLTTHYLEEAERLADRLAIIDKGRIIASGAPGEIIQRYGRPERLRVRGDARLADRLREAFPFPVTVEGGAIEVEVPAKADLVRVINFVESTGLPWSGVAAVEDTLEDVFIRLVGRLDDGAANGGPPQEGRR
ncbi:MAG TPA: ABC transporter ATP-binding protein [Thermoplasmata archaeon]|nr:ABC transporter ATP-binding protein [Thermoplasmata archaeon]